VDGTHIPVKPRVLIVDDDPANVALLEALLVPEGYETLAAADGEEAIQQVARERPDLVLLDVMMPKLDGFEAARILKGDEATNGIPIVMVTSLKDVDDRTRALEAGADDFLSKPVEKTELRARVRTLLRVKKYQDALRDYQRNLEDEVARQTLELQQAYNTIRETSMETVIRLARAAEFRDEVTGSHIQRISLYSVAIAENLGLNKDEVEIIRLASPMHDVGKIGIPDDILKKPGDLSPEEWEVMRMHTTFGARILSGSESKIIRAAEIIALTHHEKWDGSGYPEGLAGEAIHRWGRIVAVADVFDALTTRRPYKESIAPEIAFDTIREGSGGHFGPAECAAFLGERDRALRVWREYRDEATGS